MCEKRLRKIKKGSKMTRLREARRLQRLQRAPSSSDESSSPPSHPTIVPVDKALQNRVILELAWKTVALMHKNKIIQQKIHALQKETSEFIMSIRNDPEKQKTHAEQMHFMSSHQQQQTQTVKEAENVPLKIEPDV